MSKIWPVVLVLLGLAIGCSAEKSPSGPTPGGFTLTGRWNGPITIDNAEARMSWDLTQTNETVNGPVTVLLPSGIVLLNGFLSGTVSGTTLPYTISVGNGGIPSRPTCAGQLAGTMTVDVGPPASLRGPLSVTSSNCTPPFDASTITLTKN